MGEELQSTDPVANFWVWLSGKKTYAIAVALGLVTMLRYLGKIDSLTAETLTNVLIGGGIATIRHGISSMTPKTIGVSIHSDYGMGE